MPNDLYDKITKEFADFKNCIFDQSSEDVYNRAYEIIVKQQLYDILIMEQIPQDVCDLLSGKDFALDYLFQQWQKTEISLTDNIRTLILSKENLMYYDN